ncbi:M36 family metallopeptidase [Sporobolomyces salmoneus]|uniref:M36 family metallopeptidase n=1 Tax=Sporobolomyces salmoneus TaxID=183962 RepID=UPI00317CA2A0
MLFPYNKRTHLRKTALLSTVSLASSLVGSVHAISIPPVSNLIATSPRPASSDFLASSVRKSINFGPQPELSLHDADSNPSVALLAWNERSNLVSSLNAFASACDAFIDGEVPRCVGSELATTFARSLHPESQFRLVDGVVSKHTNVFHGHFAQLLDGVPIANSNLNVNVNLETGEIVSYGDSTFAKSTKSSDPKLNARKWSTGGGGAQIVLDNGPQHEDLLEEFSSPPFNPSSTSTSSLRASDPRQGLLTFLAMQSNNVELDRRLESAPRAHLVSQLSTSPIAGSAHDVLIHGAIDPTAVDEEPTKASLVYVHDGQDVKLAWKYEYKSRDNMYEAYLSADHDVTPGEEQPLMVVDWVRDFRPTGGEIGMESMYEFLDSNSNSRKVKNSKPVKSWNKKNKKRSLFGSGTPASTTDPKEISKLKELSPEYEVFPWGVNAPDVGKRKILKGSLVELDKEASPAGWHYVPSEHKGGSEIFYFETRGNNVLAQDNPDGGNSMNGFRANGGKDLKFDFPIHMTKPGTPLDPTTYIEAATTELFYTNNEIHDLFYRYGFDEVSGNFQETNFARGGLGGDAVQANAQDGSGYNNANFATPPDGSRPRMRMYVWTSAQPYRDGDFEEGIVIHEYAHGISTRLTGGPANSGCLGWGEAGGMGEGWGDFFATMIRMHSAKEQEFDMGSWASGRAGGIRNYPYSRNLTTNQDTYKSLDKGGYWGVHAIGEVWAEMLFELAENLIDDHGFHPTLFPPAVNSTDSTGYYSERHFKESNKKVPAHGNTLAIQLVVDGMKLQPCRPSFQAARDAILTADKMLTGGENRCTIWKSFAKRGLGPESRVVGSTPWGGGIRTEDYKSPVGCGKKSKKFIN